LVLESFEHVPVVGLLAKELVECDDRLFPAELSQDEDCGVLFDICRSWVRVLVEPLDGNVERFVDDLGRDRSSCLSQVTKTLRALLDQLFVVCA
jgi:hypothetical protein